MKKYRFGLLICFFLIHITAWSRVVIEDVPLNQTHAWKRKEKNLRNKNKFVNPLRIQYLTRMDVHVSSVFPMTLKGRSVFSKWYHFVYQASLKYDVPEALLMAVLKAESNFNPHAISSKGAMGLMQLMPTTGKELGVKNFFDPKENIEAGAKYLSLLLKEFSSIDLALAAYNAGPGIVKYYKGIPPYPETQVYIMRVKGYFEEINTQIKQGRLLLPKSLSQ